MDKNLFIPKIEEPAISETDKDKIRRYFDEKTGNFYFSIVDIIGIITKSSDPRNYWKVLKNRLKNGSNELVTRCNQLKMRSNDGKFYLTDAGDAQTVLEIIKQVSPGHALPFKVWFESLKEENKEEEEEFELSLDAYILENFLVVEAMVAGVDIEDIFISATTNTLTLKGKRQKSREVDERENNIQELYWGKFSRSITLPNDIEVNEIEAHENRGHLIIKLPILNKNRAKLISVKKNR